MANADRQLLNAWGEGDEAAGRRLFRRYYTPMYRFFNVKVSDGIEDMIQETFAACVAGRHRLRDENSFRAYLYGIARNLVRAHFKKARVRGEVVDIDDASAHDCGPSPSSVMHRRAEQRLLLEALRRLPLDYQIAFELFYWERMTAGEMSEVLQLSEFGVRSRLHRAKELLRRTMEDLAESPEVLESSISNLEDWLFSALPVRSSLLDDPITVAPGTNLSREIDDDETAVLEPVQPADLADRFELADLARLDVQQLAAVIGDREGGSVGRNASANGSTVVG